VEEGGKTMLVALKPTTLLAMFKEPQLEGVAREVAGSGGYDSEHHEGGDTRG
jgi:hypothetical protein